MEVASEEIDKLWIWIKRRIQAGAAQSGRKEDGAYTQGKKQKQEKINKKAEEKKKKEENRLKQLQQQETTEDTSWNRCKK